MRIAVIMVSPVKWSISVKNGSALIDKANTEKVYQNHKNFPNSACWESRKPAFTEGIIVKHFRYMAAVLFVLFATDLAFGQMGSYSSSNPRTSIGVQASSFRISYDGFDQTFDSRWGFSYGGHASWRISSTYNIVAKYRQFNKSNTATTNGIEQQFDWNERWINAGVRYIRVPDRGAMNFFGFGLSFFNIDGSGVSQVLPQNNDTADNKITSTGFFLDFGFGYPLARKLFFTIEIELTSAGIDGSGSLESSSIGGILISAGLHLFPF